jgi:hypothetical protein
MRFGAVRQLYAGLWACQAAFLLGDGLAAQLLFFDYTFSSDKYRLIPFRIIHM